MNISISDDYAVLTTKNYGFYYGYEFDEDEDEECIWGFEVNDNSKIGAFRISYEDMKKYKNCPSQWECEKCLLFGIGLWLEENKNDR